MVTTDEITEALRKHPGSTARELARWVVANKREVNSLLYTGLNAGRFTCTDTSPPRWSLPATMPGPTVEGATRAAPLGGALSHTSGMLTRAGGEGRAVAAEKSGSSTRETIVPSGFRAPLLGAWGADGPSALPTWAEWFLDAGWCLAHRRKGLKQWVVMTVPHRGFAAVLAAAGAVGRTLYDEAPHQVEDRLATLRRDDAITWVDAQGDLASGRFIKAADGYVHYQKREHGRWGEARKRPLEMCSDFWPMDPGETPFSGSRPLLSNPEFVGPALPALRPGRLAQRSTGAVLCGTQTQLLAELAAEVFSAGQSQGQLLDLVRPQGRLPLGQRAWSVLLASAGQPLDDPLTVPSGVAIFDGSQAYLRWRDSIDAPSNLVLIDRWENRAEDVVPAARSDRQQAWVDEPVIGVPDLLPGIECFSWVEEL